MRQIYFLMLFCGGLSIAGAAAVADTLIVGNKGVDTVSFIDLETGAEIAEVKSGNAPHEVAVRKDGRIAVVVNYGANSVDVYAVASASHVKSISLGRHSRPHGILWLPDQKHVAITTEGSRHLVVVDVEAGAVVNAIATGQRSSHMVAVSPDGSRAFVANIAAGTFTAIDLKKGVKLRDIKAGDDPEAIAVTPDGREVWVGNNGSHNVMVYDAETLERKAVIKTGRTPIRVQISPDGQYAVTADIGDGHLSVIDTAAKKIIRTVALDGGEGTPRPVTLLFQPDGTRLFAALPSLARVAIIDTASWRQTGLLTAKPGSDGLGYSPLNITR